MHQKADHGSMKVLTVTSTNQCLVGANPKRVALTVTCNGIGAFSISDRSEAVYGEGWSYQGKSLPATLDRNCSGDFVQRGLWFISSGGTLTVTVIEVLCSCGDPPLTP